LGIFRQLIRSADTTWGVPPSSAKHSLSIANVVVDFSSAANRTNRHLDLANTAQNTSTPPRLPHVGGAGVRDWPKGIHAALKGPTLNAGHTQLPPFPEGGGGSRAQ